MSLNRLSFLEGWEHTGFLRRRSSASVHTNDSDSYESLPDTASQISSSLPSTYSRLNFNPYAGPGWNETADDHDDRPSLLGLGSLGFGLGVSPTTTQVQDRRVDSPLGGGGAGVSPVAVPASGIGSRGAFEVSPPKRIAQVVVAVVYCFLAAGVVFGFAAIKPVLIRENVYRNLCSKEELDRDVAVCVGQEIRLNLMFTIAAVATNVSALPVGTILDAYGPRVCGILGSLCLAIGAVLLAFAKHLPFDGFILGYLLFSLGGPFIFISSFHLSNTFPRHSGLILSTLTGAFDASSALFLIFRLLNEHTQGYVSTQKFFLAYLAVPALIAVAQVTIMPATSYQTLGELVLQVEAHVKDEMNDSIDNSNGQNERERRNRREHRQRIVREIHGLLHDSTSPMPSTVGIDDSIFTQSNTHSPTHITTHPQDQAETQPLLLNNHSPPSNSPAKDPIHGILHGLPATHQLLTPWFTLITLFTALTMLRINYLISTLHQQYTYLLDGPTSAKALSHTFDILLPLGGLLSAPLTGVLLDTLPTKTTLIILVTTASLLGVLGCIPHSLPAAYTNIILFVLYRPFYYTSVSDYAAKVFGFATFGKVYGVIICVAGVGNFAQTGLDTLTLRRFHGDPLPVNVGLTCIVAIVGVVFVGFVWWKSWEVQGRARMGLESGVGEGVAGEREGADGHGSAHTDGSGDRDGIESRDWERRSLLRDGRGMDTENGRRYGT